MQHDCIVQARTLRTELSAQFGVVLASALKIKAAIKHTFKIIILVLLHGYLLLNFNLQIISVFISFLKAYSMFFRRNERENIEIQFQPKYSAKIKVLILASYIFEKKIAIMWNLLSKLAYFVLDFR